MRRVINSFSEHFFLLLAASIYGHCIEFDSMEIRLEPINFISHTKYSSFFFRLFIVYVSYSFYIEFNNNDQYVHRTASAFKWLWEGELLLSICSWLRIDFYQRQFSCYYCFCWCCFFIVIAFDLVLLSQRWSKKQIIWSLLKPAVKSACCLVIVFIFVDIHFDYYFFVVVRRALSNELLPLKMQKHLTLFLMHA